MYFLWEAMAFALREECVRGGYPCIMAALIDKACVNGASPPTEGEVW